MSTWRSWPSLPRRKPPGSPLSTRRPSFYGIPIPPMPGVKPFLPAPAAYPAAGIRPRYRPRAHRRSDGPAGGRRPPAPGTSRRAAGRSSASAASAPGPTPGRRRFPAWAWSATSSTRPRSTPIIAAYHRGPAGRDRPAARGQAVGLDDAPHRQLGDGGSELERRLPRGVPAAPRLRSRCPSCRSWTGRIVDSPEISERFLWDLRKTAQELVVDKPHPPAQGARTARRIRAVRRALRHEPMRRPDAGGRGRRADGRVLGPWLRLRHLLQRLRGRLDRPHAGADGRRRRGLHGRRQRGLAAPPRGDERPGRLGSGGRDQSLRLPPLRPPAAARPGARHDHGALRRPLRKNPDLVGDVVGLEPLPVPLPVPAAARSAGGRYPIPRARRGAPGLRAAAVGALGTQARPEPRQLPVRRLRPGKPDRAGDGQGRPHRLPRRGELRRARPPGARNHHPRPACARCGIWPRPVPRSSDPGPRPRWDWKAIRPRTTRSKGWRKRFGEARRRSLAT